MNEVAEIEARLSKVEELAQRGKQNPRETFRNAPDGVENKGRSGIEEVIVCRSG